MSRNAESRFALNPTNIELPRSTFNRNYSHKTTFNAGELIPFHVEEVLPGDTYKMKTNFVIRLQTPLTPFMDNAYVDTYDFFVPFRLLWPHWKNFMGEPESSPWVPEVEYNIPMLRSPSDGYRPGSIADYMGIPCEVDPGQGITGIYHSALPFRAYALICNEWFRDQNLQDPILIPLDDSTRDGSRGDNQVTDIALGGMPFKANKFHDYFTSCLPEPQRGDPVTIGLTSSPFLPVIPMAESWDPMLLTSVDGATNNYKNIYNSGQSGSIGFNSQGEGARISGSGITITDGAPIITNLHAYTGGDAVAVTINELRMAFQMQKFLERDARGGVRYREILKSHFGVTSPDSRMQIPEYLGGHRVPINVNQVIQQSSSAEGTPQGTVTGMSLTTDSHEDFIKSFTEHGYIISVCVVRYDHTYQQGLERFWSRKSRYDFYWPTFAHIGEQAVLNKEIYCQGYQDEEPVDNEVFGYQEAWADYRFKPSRVSGEMRSNTTNSLDVWHLADDYSSLPRLSASWIREDKSNVDRVLSVTSEVANQFFADFYIENEVTRVMPMYSIPGLIDHF